MEFTANDPSITSESAPLIPPVDGESDQDLFMVPLKRPSPRLPPSRYRNVRPRSPPRSPALSPRQRSNLGLSPRPGSQGQPEVNPYQSPAMSGCTIKPETPPMFGSPLMSPDSGMASGRSPNLQGSAAQRSMPGSMSYNSPAMSGRETKAGSSPIISTEADSAHQSPDPDSSSGKGQTTLASRTSRTSADKTDPSTKASSIPDNTNAPAITHTKPEPANDDPPAIPPLSSARTKQPTPTANLGLALTINPALLHVNAPPGTPGTNPKSPGSHNNWTVPDSPLDRLSQLRATPDSAYDRARQMEVRRSEWKHVVYRFPVAGKDNWVIDADLTESSHARLADVARRSSEGFEFNGDAELAGIYRVLALAHGRVMEEMRAERRAASQGGTGAGGIGGSGGSARVRV